MFQRPLTLILLQKYRDTNGRRIVIQIGGVYTTLCQKEGILLPKYRDRNGRCIAILFKSIRVRGRFDSPEKGQGKIPWVDSACADCPDFLVLGAAPGPGFHLRLGALGYSPGLAFCFMGLWRFAWMWCPQLPYHRCKNGSTAHVFTAQGGTCRKGGRVCTNCPETIFANCVFIWVGGFLGGSSPHHLYCTLPPLEYKHVRAQPALAKENIQHHPPWARLLLPQDKSKKLIRRNGDAHVTVTTVGIF